MGTNLPAGNRQTLEWLEGHIVGWNANFASIGLTSAQVIDLAGDVANVRQSFTDVQQIRDASKAETSNFNQVATDLHTKAAGLVSTIKSFATTSGNSAAVYLAAEMTPADPPSPMPAPATPTNLNANVNPNGDVIVSWDGTGPSGTLYEVYRKLDGETTFDLLGVVDALTKEFNDATLTVGSTFATYMIRAVRSGTASANSTQFNIQFGPTAPPIAGEAAA